MSFLNPIATLLCCIPFVAHGEHPTPASSPEQIAQHAPHNACTKPEQLALRMLVRSLLMQHYDANHDGILNREELSAIRQETRAHLGQHAKKLAQRFDRDKDGKLSQQERDEMRQSFSHAPQSASQKEHRHHHRGAHRRHHHRMGKMARAMAYTSHQLLLRAYDQDKSGQLEEQEMAHCRQDAHKMFRVRQAALLSRFDTNHDNTLTEEEYQAALKQLIPQEAENTGTTPHQHKRRRLPYPLSENVTILYFLSHSECCKSTN